MRHEARCADDACAKSSDCSMCFGMVCPSMWQIQSGCIKPASSVLMCSTLLQLMSSHMHGGGIAELLQHEWQVAQSAPCHQTSCTAAPLLEEYAIHVVSSRDGSRLTAATQHHNAYISADRTGSAYACSVCSSRCLRCHMDAAEQQNQTCKCPLSVVVASATVYSVLESDTARCWAHMDA